MYLIKPSVWQLKLQERLQKREGLVTRKGELDAEAKSCDREIKVNEHLFLALMLQLVYRLVS